MFEPWFYIVAVFEPWFYVVEVFEPWFYVVEVFEPWFYVVAYWNSSLPHGGARHQGARQRVVTPRDESGLMDDESRRLIEDANLLISRDSLILCDIIGQGQSEPGSR